MKLESIQNEVQAFRLRTRKSFRELKNWMLAGGFIFYFFRFHKIFVDGFYSLHYFYLVNF